MTLLLKIPILFLYLSSLFSAPIPQYETAPIIQVVLEAPTTINALAGIDYSTLPYTYKPDILTVLADAEVVKVSADFSLPLDYDSVDIKAWSRPHHDYPALDVVTPVGSPVYAITAGIVVAATGNNGEACGGQVQLKTDVGQFMYCHLSKVVVKYGDVVEPGQLVAYSGGRPGAYGAGDSTTPHVHIGLIRSGKTVCPQPLMVSIVNGLDPDISNSTKCHT